MWQQTPLSLIFLRFFLHVPESGFRQTVGLIEKYTKMPDVRLFAKALGERAMCVRMDGVMRPWLSARATRSSGNPGRVTSGSHPKRQSRADCPRQERPMTPMTVSVPGKKIGSPSRGIFTGSRREPSPSQTMREGMSRIFRRNEREGDAHFGVAVFGDADERSADTWALEQKRFLETGIPQRDQAGRPESSRQSVPVLFCDKNSARQNPAAP